MNGSSTPPLRVGTRAGALARAQTAEVLAALAAAGAGPCVVVEITTAGDASRAPHLAVAGADRGWFTREIDRALIEGRIDLAVHSLKDLPTALEPGTYLAAVTARRDAADALVTRAPVAAGVSFAEALGGRTVGTSSLRRAAFSAHHAPLVRHAPLRGNVPTRLDALRAGVYDAIILAAAGLARLAGAADDLYLRRLNPRLWPPAPGQGALGLVTRESDARARAAAAAVACAASTRAAGAERALLSAFAGGCSTPFGAYVHGNEAVAVFVQNGTLMGVRGPVPDPDPAAWLSGAVVEPPADPFFDA